MKANILINTLNLDRNEWLKYRTQGIGGSDVGAIIGINKWKSVLDVYLEKIGEAPREDITSEAAYWGNTLEEVVAREFSARTGKKVRRRNAMLQHPEHPFMLANVDREIVGENAILECKTTSEYNKELWSGEQVPDSYMLQVQHYLAVGGYERGYIACLIGGNKFVWYEINRDEELINYIMEIETDFWNKVENRTPPEIDGSEAAEKLVKKMFPSAEDKEITLDNETEILAIERQQLKEQIKELETQLAEKENKIKMYLKEAEKAEGLDYIITWKNTKGRETFDSKQFKKDFPQLYNNYIHIGEGTRKFDIKHKKEEVKA